MEHTPELVAAIDLGSNSFHMIVSKLRDGELHTVDRIREMVRLAAGLDTSKNLSQQAQKRALHCLEKFGERLRSMPRGSVRAVGTNTLRKARNSPIFLEKAEQALGHPIDIISGNEEARLIYMGVSHSLSFDKTRRLVMDIGGGSTELIIGDGSVIKTKESLHMGCVSMSQMQFPDGKITKSRFNRAVIQARQELEASEKHFKAISWDESVGASGTLRAVNKVLTKTGWCEDGITLDGLEKLVENIVSIGNTEDLDLPNLNPERKPVFPGGVAIVYAAFKTLEIKKMCIANGALREGVLHDLLGRILHTDSRSKSITTIADRYHADIEHAERVNSTAQKLLEQILIPEPIERESASNWLEWGIKVHEIGRNISHSQFHKHSAYILENADLPGFGQQEQQFIAFLVRGHRRKIPVKLFEDVPTPWRETLIILIVILRLAAVLHRSRDTKPLPIPPIEINNDCITMKFSKSWLKKHPLTHADLEQEANYLELAGIKASLVKV